MATWKMRRIAAVAAVSALLVAGCSGGDSGSGTSQQSTTDESTTSEQQSSPAGTSEQTASSSDPAQPLIKVKAGILPIIYDAPFHIAQQKGYFAEEGLEVTSQEFSGFQPEVAAVLNGEVDFGYTSVVPIIVAVSKGVELSLVTTTDTSGVVGDGTEPADLLLTAPGSEVSLKDLSGETIGVSNVGGISELTVRSAVDNAGGDSTTLSFTDVPFESAADAINQGRVKAAVVSEPFLAGALAAGLVPVDTYPQSGLDDMPISGIYVTKTYLAENADTVARFKRAMDKATAAAAEDPDMVRELIPTFTQIPAETAATVRLPQFKSGIRPERVEALAQLAAKYGFSEGEVNVSELIAQ